MSQYTGDFRSHVRDVGYPWRAVTPEILARLRPPPEDTDTFVDEVRAEIILGIELRPGHIRERLRVPRVAPNRYRVYELYAWLAINGDPFAAVRQGHISQAHNNNNKNESEQ